MKNFLIKCGLIMSIVAAVVLFISRYSIISLFNKPVDIFAEGVENPDDIKPGMAIETDMYLLMDCFASEETSYKNRSGQVSSTSTDYYYILPVFVGEEDTYYIAMEVSGKSDNLSTINRIANETMSYLMGTGDTFGSYSLDIRGYVTKLDKEAYGYMTDWFEDAQFFTSDAELDKYVLPYVFNFYIESRVKAMAIIFAVIFVLGIALLVLGLLKDRKYSERRKLLKKSEKEITINGNSLRVCMMDDVDILVWKGATKKAENRIKKYGANDTQAQQIIASWNEIVGL